MLRSRKTSSNGSGRRREAKSEGERFTNEAVFLIEPLLNFISWKLSHLAFQTSGVWWSVYKVKVSAAQEVMKFYVMLCLCLCVVRFGGCVEIITPLTVHHLKFFPFTY